MIKAILFDFGDTIFTFGKVDTIAMFKEGARLTYDYLKSAGVKLPSFRRYLYVNLACIYLRVAYSALSGKDFDSLKLIRFVNERLGLRLSNDRWQKIAWLWYEPLSKTAVLEPDIRQTLAKLRDMGLQLGIVSNTFLNQRSLDHHLEQFGLLEFFPLRVYSCETLWRKPHIRIFRVAAGLLRLPPENIAFVGDRLDTDIRGSINAGMIPILKSAHSNEGKPLPPSVQKINSLADLPSLIEKLNASPLKA